MSADPSINPHPQPLIASDNTLPSRSVILLSAYPASTGSCVTSTSVVPSVLFRSSSSRSTASPFHRIQIPRRLIRKNDRRAAAQKPAPAPPAAAPHPIAAPDNAPSDPPARRSRATPAPAPARHSAPSSAPTAAAHSQPPSGSGSAGTTETQTRSSFPSPAPACLRPGN